MVKDIALVALITFNVFIVVMFKEQRDKVSDFESQVQFAIAEFERESDCNNQVLAVEAKTESTVTKQNNMIDGFIRLIQAVKEMEKDEEDTDNS